jgi:branched-chain amino acid transport system permease protein
MAYFIALLASGIALGAVVALVALGFLVLYKATGVINFAHGDLMTLGAYLSVWTIVDLKMPTLLGYLAVLVLMFLAGLVLERLAYAPLRDRPVVVVVISTLGAATVIRGLIALWQGSTPRKVSPPLGNGVWHVFGAAIVNQRLIIVGVTAAVVIGLLVLFLRTSFGRQVRALAADRETARLQGVRVRRMSMVAFGMSSALAGLAGILIAPLVAVDLNLGFGVMLTAFAAAILGGFGSIGGVVVGAIIIGLVQQVLGGYVFTSYSEVLPYALILIVLAVRPAGLFAGTAGARL